ncbi:hypothetical protein [Candidatus Tremblaya phenacola]|uniref:hypothetical protein n=1 Tax=Candidatus Tremblayella phenacoccinincola TaxID=1010676 RepID=UPI001980B67F|nr:hypothetical protein [Candidatus Tremblaya phenacola]
MVLEFVFVKKKPFGSLTVETDGATKAGCRALIHEVQRKETPFRHVLTNKNNWESGQKA